MKAKEDIMSKIMFDPRDEDEQNINYNTNTMKKEVIKIENKDQNPEDYRYGYQHIAILSGKQVSVRKKSGCGGWINIDNDQLHPNKDIYILGANDYPISSRSHKYMKLDDSKTYIIK